MSKVRLRLVDENHPVCASALEDWPLARLPANARMHIKKWNVAEAEWAVIAMNGDTMVGFYRFQLWRNYIVSLGTWVDPSHRRMGMASRMWSKAISEFPGYKVEVTAVSGSGEAFVEFIKSRYPEKVVPT